MKRKFTLAIGLIFQLGFFARSQGYIYDQQSPPPFVTFAESGYFIGTNQPIGQSFTPTLSSIDFIFLQLEDYYFNNGTGAVIFVKLFSGSITNGTLLGSTAPISFPDGFGVSTVGYYGETNFVFPSSIALTPGIQYFLQPVLLSGDASFYLGVGNLNYPGGTAYINGTPNINGWDLWFREGIIAVPEPDIMALAILGTLGLLVGKKRQRKLLKL